MDNTVGIAIDSWGALGRGYASGLLFAGYHFVQRNPDWYCRLGEGCFYAVAWPYSIYKGLFS